jgi:hypothetical protein
MARTGNGDGLLTSVTTITVLRLLRRRAPCNLQDMPFRNHKNFRVNGPHATEPVQTNTFTKPILFTVLAIIALAGVSLAGELPGAPSSMVRATPTIRVASATNSAAAVSSPKIAEVNPVDKRFIGFAVISTASTFSDSYTTLFARQNWLAHKQGVCNVEVQSAYLYGTHPTVGRAYAVASVKSASAIFASYYLRKHHSRFWVMPFAANSIVSLEGVTQNMIECN